MDRTHATQPKGLSQMYVNIAIVGDDADSLSDLAERLGSQSREEAPSPPPSAAQVWYTEYEVGSKHIAQAVIPPECQDFATVFTTLRSMDTVLVLIREGDTIPPFVAERCCWARAAGIPTAICISLQESGALERREKRSEGEPLRFLEELGFTTNDVVVVRGIPQDYTRGKASPGVNELLQTLKKSVLPRPRDSSSPFFMPIDDVFSITGRGTIVTGKVERGVVRKGTTVEIVGPKEARQTTVLGVEMFRGVLDEAVPGDHVGILLRDIRKEEVSRGMALCAPGSIISASQLAVDLRVLNESLSGRTTLLASGNSFELWSGSAMTTAQVASESPDADIPAGAQQEVLLDILKPMPAMAGDGIVLRAERRTVAIGTVKQTRPTRR